MKKIIALILILLLFLLSGCQSNKSSVSDIKITIDQQTLNEVNQGIQNYKNDG